MKTMGGDKSLKVPKGNILMRSHKKRDCKVLYEYVRDRENINMTVRKSSQAVPLLAMQALRGEEVYSSYSSLTSALDGVSGQHHALAAL
jgi:hypothetical protein